MNIVAYS